MKIILAGSEHDEQLFAICFDPDCVFEIIPAHGGAWSATFRFGTEPSESQRSQIEVTLLELLRQ